MHTVLPENFIIAVIIALKLFPVEDGWGIGCKGTHKLKYHSIKSAWDLTQKTESWVKREPTITGVRTWKELHGVSCIDVEDLAHKKSKSICTSRSFADQGINELSLLEETIANFAAACVRKLLLPSDYYI